MGKRKSVRILAMLGGLTIFAAFAAPVAWTISRPKNVVAAKVRAVGGQVMRRSPTYWFGTGDVVAVFLDRTGITDSQFKEIAADASALNTITIISLADTSVTDAVSSDIRKFSRLETLFLGATDVRGERLAELREVSTLDTLWLQTNDLSDEGWEQLASLKQLERLDLGGTNVSDREMALIARLPRLRSVSLSHTKVSDDTLRKLAQTENVVHIDVYGTDVTAEAVKDVLTNRWGTSIHHESLLAE